MASSETQTLKEELTCASCRHFHREPVVGIPVLGQTPTGECRHSPPQCILSPTRGGGMQLGTLYPKVTDEFPGCGQHTALRQYTHTLPLNTLVFGDTTTS